MALKEYFGQDPRSILSGLGQGQNLAVSESGPLAIPEVLKRLKLAGYNVKVDENGEPVVAKDENPELKNYAALQDYAKSAPSEIDLSLVAGLANFLSTTSRKIDYKAPDKADTANGRMAQYADITGTMAALRDKEQSRQSDLLKSLLGAQGEKVSISGGVRAPQMGLGDVRPRNPTAQEIDHLSEAKAAVEGVERVTKAIKENKDLMGPLMGTYYSAGNSENSGLMAQAFAKLRDAKDPNANRAQALISEIDRMRQFLGKPAEGGVLRKEDETKYQKILADLSKNPDVAVANLENFTTELSNRAKERLKLLRSSNVFLGPEYSNYEQMFGEKGARPHENLSGSGEFSGSSSGLTPAEQAELDQLRKEVKR